MKCLFARPLAEARLTSECIGPMWGHPDRLARLALVVLLLALPFRLLSLNDDGVFCKQAGGFPSKVQFLNGIYRHRIERVAFPDFLFTVWLNLVLVLSLDDLVSFHFRCKEVLQSSIVPHLDARTLPGRTCEGRMRDFFAIRMDAKSYSLTP